jgi:eukaryotic-like serine/threonine-protein kinase
MNECIRDRCKGFLAGSLSQAEESGFVTHLEECPQCRSWLEQEAGDEQIWGLTRELLQGSPLTEGGPGSGPVHDFDVADGSRQAYPELAFLAPSEDPAMVGRLGTYEIIGVLGRGGMGIVLKGFDRALSRNVAIKVLDPVLANVAAARQRFAREARAMAAVSHEHVVPVYAVDEHGSLPYFVMEYVPGGTLERRLIQDGPLEPIEVVRVGMQVAQGLAAAHAQGLVHRDIKPSNILLDQGTERVRVADFGLARTASDASFTRSGILAGTPLYMAPEQIRGEPCGAQSDLFSLGSLMYALCVGHPPFRGETVYAVMQRIIHDRPRSLREQNPTVPAWLEEFVMRLLAKESTQRFASAEEVAEILEQELAHLQSPHIVVQPTRPWRGVMRRRLTAVRPPIWRAMLGAAVVLISIGTGWLLRSPPPPAGEGTATSQVDREKSAPPSTVPLWDADGLGETRAAAAALEAQWRRAPAEPPIDPWQQASQDLRRRVAELTEAQGVWTSDNP